jgi:hypothetical protein
MSRLSDPNPPSDRPLAANTPRWQQRHLGAVVAVLIVSAFGWAAWHFTHQVEGANSRDVPIPISR